jgi:hypothetical protein
MKQIFWLCVISLGILCFFLAVDAGSEALAERVLFDFDRGTSAWTLLKECPAGQSIDSLSSPLDQKGKSLSLSLSFPGEGGAMVSLNETWRDYQSLSCEFFLPDDAPSDVKVFLYVKDKDWLWYQTATTLLPQGKKILLRADISSASLDWLPVGHKKPWNPYTPTHIRELGIRVSSSTSSNCMLFLDNFQLQPTLFSNLRIHRNEVQVYQRFEVSFTIPYAFENPFDPECVAVDGSFILPSGKEEKVPGFFFQNYTIESPGEKWKDLISPEGEPEWRVRFCPVEPGRYRFRLSCSIDGGKSLFFSSEYSFWAIRSDRPGFIRLHPSDSRYFFREGTGFFYPLGHNIRSLYDTRDAQVRKAPLAGETGILEFRKWLADMEQSGENFFETWMAAWWLAVEWKKGADHYEGVGRYNLVNAWKLDWLLEEAESRGCYIQLLICNHGSLSTFCDQEWQDNPYNSKNGGIVSSPEEFFTDPAARTAFKKRVRYIVARWGYSPHIFSWELLNEMNLVGSKNNFYREPVLKEWYREMSRFLAEIDPWNHLITGHYTILYNSDVFALPEVGYVATNAYYGDPKKNNIVKVLSNIVKFNAQFGKPQIVAEFGGSSMAGTEERLEADLHNGIWAGFHLPFASSPLLWWHNFIEDRNLYFHFSALAQYIKGEDLPADNLVPGSLSFSGDAKNRAAGLVMKNEKKALIWIYLPEKIHSMKPYPVAEAVEGVECTISDLQSGAYTVQFWDTLTGDITHEIQAVSDGSLRFSLPKLFTDCAIKIIPVP